MKTLIVFSHQYFENSKINKALLKAAKSLSGVQIRNLDELYGTNIKAFDIQKEQGLLSRAERVVFQFPLFWLSTPPMLKAYLDEVLTYGFAYGSEANALEGKKFDIAVSLGSTKGEYSKLGSNGHSIEEFLLPLRRTASFCKMEFGEIFVSDGAFGASEDDISNFAKKYIAFLK